MIFSMRFHARSSLQAATRLVELLQMRPKASRLAENGVGAREIFEQTNLTLQQAVLA
jgi:hypothetical protein